MTQVLYIEKVLKRFKIENSKGGFLPMRHGVKLSKTQSPKIDEEIKKMCYIPYASAVGSLQYDVQCTRPDIAFALSVTIDIKHVLVNGDVVAWKSSKQDTTANSTTKAEYISASEAAKEAIWMKNYIQDLGVVPSIVEPIVIFCDNNGVIAQAKELRSHRKSKHIFRYYHLLREMVGRGDVRVDCFTLTENTADSLTKPVSQIA
ncbi:UNVERIFIED_CONTAM: Retrovirus-related Pol polyprotein from transposon TNT 1-94 [Sesamum angustifolium]|uniref:Retrovirus-related Pol polyprotein from transposon TNT 1-94 n=1 Tax=Sesamum angustifolium TaxID=2727405 RepID=A0AAW2NAE3_9LAMI